MLFNEHHILPFFFCTWKNRSGCSGFVDLDGKIQSNLEDKCLSIELFIFDIWKIGLFLFLLWKHRFLFQSIKTCDWI